MTSPTADRAASHPPIRTVSVAVCTRDRRDTIGDCVASLLDQDIAHDTYEIIIVDDGSTDGTKAIGQRLADDHPARVRFVSQRHAGLSVARNRAITEGTGELVCFLDDDAVASPGWVSAMIDAARRHPEVDCFGGRLLLRLEGPAPRTCAAESLGASLDLGDDLQAIERVKGSNMAIRRSAFERIGLFNPALVWRGDEDNWMHRLTEQGGRALYVPDALVWHRRLASDLKLWKLLRTRFGWGVGQVQYKRETGEPFHRRAELRALRAGLAHAYRDRCTGGLLQASIKLGALWGALAGELRKPPQDAPHLRPSGEPG